MPLFIVLISYVTAVIGLGFSERGSYQKRSMHVYGGTKTPAKFGYAITTHPVLDPYGSDKLVYRDGATRDIQFVSEGVRVKLVEVVGHTKDGSRVGYKCYYETHNGDAQIKELPNLEGAVDAVQYDPDDDPDLPPDGVMMDHENTTAHPTEVTLTGDKFVKTLVSSNTMAAGIFRKPFNEKGAVPTGIVMPL